MESLLDQESLKRRQKNFGWKHANVCPKVLSKLPKFENVCFIFIVRNPWRFISSCIKNHIICCQDLIWTFRNLLSLQYIQTKGIS